MSKHHLFRKTIDVFVYARAKPPHLVIQSQSVWSMTSKVERLQSIKFSKYSFKKYLHTLTSVWHCDCGTHSVYSRINRPLHALGFLVGSIIWFVFWLWNTSLGLEHVNLGIPHQLAVGWDDGFALSFGVKWMWNSTLFVGGINQGWGSAGSEGEEARGGYRWHFRFQGFVSRSCCGCRVKRRWAVGSMRSQLLYPDWGCQSACAKTYWLLCLFVCTQQSTNLLKSKRKTEHLTALF